MTSVLRHINVTDFRSIRGSLSIPLDAPVVLIHGQNGAGKTSLLSAIELALTGDVPSLRRVDPAYLHHLVHKQATTASISVADVTRSVEAPTITVSKGRISGTPLLDIQQGRFFSERCFLAQATLARLLEIYEHVDARGTDSALTRFVKDLLGLDDLDALVNGLHDAGHISRIRHAVPAYLETHTAIVAIEGQLQKHREADVPLEASEQRLGAALTDLLARLGVTTSLPQSLEQLSALSLDTEGVELQELARVRRDASALGEQWQAASSPGLQDARTKAEGALADASVAVNRWREAGGTELESRLAEIGQAFPRIANYKAGGLEASSDRLVAAIVEDLDRCNAQLDREEKNSKRISILEQDIAQVRERLSGIQERIAETTADAGDLAEALSRVLGHIHGNDCPLCGRDYGEVSQTPLQAHVAGRIAALTESAGRLRALSRERATTTDALSQAEAERATLAGRQLTPTVVNETKTRRAYLEESKLALLLRRPMATEGDRLAELAAVAARELGDQRSGDERVASIRTACNGLASKLGIAVLDTAESLEAGLRRVAAAVDEREAVLNDRQKLRREATSTAQSYRDTQRKRLEISLAIQHDEIELGLLRRARSRADERIADAKELTRRVRDVRTGVVRRVFNDALNTLWRDLFVRLAPEEPFVPAFALPTDITAPVEALLETHYRSGGKGGNPRAMLSAGNLNTAALTLFLALHLSVQPTVPCLVIDDPIQSMDEVHISQFAALLRTLSKRHARQVIVAVHERPLFEYLTLELSPAFETDRLITIELGRNAEGDSIAHYEPHTWQPDVAIPA